MARRVLVTRLGSGGTDLVAAPVPKPAPDEVVVRNVASLVSAGTERMLAEFGRANAVEKVRQQPERVAEVVSKVRTDGLLPTVEAVRSKLYSPTTLGYASAGIVVDVGSAVDGIAAGELVATNGNHAEVVAVPRTFCVPVPAGVSVTHACFATVASVGLQGIRLAEARLGERFVVIGLGLIGLITVQLLQAQGCAVLGVDVDERRLELAKSFGAATAPAGDGSVTAARAFSHGRGVDGVLVCAATKSNDPIHHAAQMCRQRGRIVLVGVTGLELDRADFYDKELSFQVSCSYGPGKYDPSYESGHDYPIGIERWTAGRNMEAVLDLLAAGRLDVASLITNEFDFDDAGRAYQTLLDDPSAIGIVLRYPEPRREATAADSASATAATLPSESITEPRSRPGARGTVGLIGAGGFADRVLIPAIRQVGGSIVAIASRGGTDAAIVAAHHDIARSTTDIDSLFTDPAIDTLVVASRHNSHAKYVERALAAGKHVFVEKPLAITSAELNAVVAAVDQAASADTTPLVGIGFNRRFAPITMRMDTLLQRVPGPKSLILTMNAGSVAPDHWIQDPSIGGGRIIGEAIHLIDLARHLVKHPIVEVTASFVESDTATLTLGFADSSLATVHYFANGAQRFPKERIEVFGSGKVLVNDNFRKLQAYGFDRRPPVRTRRQDKGHVAGARAFLDAVRVGGAAPIPFNEIVEVHRAVLAATGR